MIQTVTGTLGTLNETLTELGIKAIGIADQVPIVINVSYLTPTQLIVMAFSVFVCALVAHEIGHYMYARLYDKDAKVIFRTNGWRLYLGTEYLQSTMSSLQEKRMLITGIVFGTLPIFAACAAHTSMFVLIAPYIVGCYKDIKELFTKL